MEKALFIDLDGTLMRKDLVISNRNKEALRQALKAGYKVVLVSGRPIQFMDYLAQGIDCWVKTIGFNGAYSKDLIDMPIAKAEVKRIYELCQKMGIKALFKTKNGIYANSDIIPYFVYPISDDKHIDYYEHCSIEVIEKEKILKILGVYQGVDEDLAHAAIQDMDVNSAFYKGKGFELSNRLINKGIAIKQYCLKNNISIQASYFFGDDVNDISMFSLGGHNMVMANGDKQVIEMADFICDTCEEDGVAKVVEKLAKGDSYV